MSAVYIEVSAEVRYWDDATVNDCADDNGALIPHRKDGLWCPIIRLADGLVMDWPAGVVADVHYKICDAGEYWLLNENMERIGKWAGYYVPDEFLCHGDNGYGDYIILKIGADGHIQEWIQPEIEWNHIEGVESVSAWIPIVPDAQKRLHDAAPDLMAALQAAVEWGAPFKDAPSDSRPGWFGMARAAIAKAEGRAA